MRSHWATWAGVCGLVGACATEPAAPWVPPGDVARCEVAPPPALHRLSRRQLGYALSDLLGVDPSVSMSLPADLQDGGLGVATASQRLDAPWSAAWLRVASDAVSAAFDGAGDLALLVDPAVAATVDVAVGHDEPFAVFTEPTSLTWEVEIAEPGVYDVDVIARKQTLFQEGDAIDDDDAVVTVRFDGAEIERVVLSNEGDEGMHHVVRATLNAGQHRVVADIAPSVTRFASIASVHLRPSAEDGPRRRTAVLDRWVSCNPREDAGCVREVVAGFARVAWRAEASDDAVDALVEAVDLSGETDVYDGLASAFLAVLLDPAFLFLVEAPAPVEGRLRSPHELLARWATILWESVPDEARLACADAGWQGKGCTQEAVVEAMLSDARADRFLRDLVVGWLGLDTLESLAEQGAPLDPALRDAMVTSAMERLRRVLVQGDAIGTLLAGSTTWVDGTLAAHYGVSATARGWVEVPGHTLGWLTDAATLTAHSQPARTSPTRRGRFVWERLHCLEVGDRPAVVPSVDVVEPGAGIETLLAEIGRDPACASCHGHLDPLGLSLEGFDEVGRSRMAPPLTQPWVLDDGTVLGSPEAVVHWLGENDAFASCAKAFLGTWLVYETPSAATSCSLGALTTASDGGDWLRDALLSDALRVRGEDVP